MPEVTIFPSIVNAPEFTTSWLPFDGFQVGDATLAERATLRTIAGINVNFPERCDDDDDVVFIGELIRAEGRRCFFYAAEYTSAVRRRVRSHLGFLRRSLKEPGMDAIEFEIDVGGGYSHFVAVGQVTDVTVPALYEGFLSDSQRSFLLFSSRNHATEEFARRMLVDCGPKLPGPTYVNYLRLVLDVCPAGDVLCRIGGRSGDGDSDVQLFVAGEDLEMWTNRIDRILREERA